MQKQTKTDPHLMPMSDEERRRMWQVIQGLCAQVLLDNKGHDIKFVAEVKP